MYDGKVDEDWWKIMPLKEFLTPLSHKDDDHDVNDEDDVDDVVDSDVDDVTIKPTSVYDYTSIFR